MPGVIGTLMVSEVIKLIIGKGEILKGELLIYDALKQSFRKVKIPKNPECAVCGDNPTITGHRLITDENLHTALNYLYFTVKCL